MSRNMFLNWSQEIIVSIPYRYDMSQRWLHMVYGFEIEFQFLIGTICHSFIS